MRQQLLNDVPVQTVAGVVAEEEAVLFAVGQDEEGQAAEVLSTLDIGHDGANLGN